MTAGELGAPGTAGEGYKRDDSQGTRVTCVELVDPGKPQAVEITDNYVVIVDGTAHVAGVQKYSNGTHVITVKGVRP